MTNYEPRMTQHDITKLMTMLHREMAGSLGALSLEFVRHSAFVIRHCSAPSPFFVGFRPITGYCSSSSTVPLIGRLSSLSQ